MGKDTVTTLSVYIEGSHPMLDKKVFQWRLQDLLREFGVDSSIIAVDESEV